MPGHSVRSVSHTRSSARSARSRPKTAERGEKLAEKLASPAPFHQVLDPDPDLQLAARLNALRYCCPNAPEGTLRKEAKNRSKSLLELLRRIQAQVTASGPKRAKLGTSKAGKSAKMKAAAKTKARQAGCKAFTGKALEHRKLAEMLAEAAAAEQEQVQFLEAQAAVSPEQRFANRKRKRPALWTPEQPMQLTCCACREQGPVDAMVACQHAASKLKTLKKNMKQWLQSTVREQKTGKKIRSTRDDMLEQFRQNTKSIELHVFCPSCLRSYLMGTRVHGGDLGKMFCPGCTKMLRDSAEASTGGAGRAYWCHQCSMYHYDDEFDMSGLGLDGIRDETGMTHIQPLSPKELTRVLGPLDLLRLRDVASSISRPPRVPRGLLQSLRAQGARRCRFCGQASVAEGGCNAVLCEFCGLVFDWDTAKLV